MHCHANVIVQLVPCGVLSCFRNMLYSWIVEFSVYMECLFATMIESQMTWANTTKSTFPKCSLFIYTRVYIWSCWPWSVAKYRIEQRKKILLLAMMPSFWMRINITFLCTHTHTQTHTQTHDHIKRRMKQRHPLLSLCAGTFIPYMPHMTHAWAKWPVSHYERTFLI